MKTFYNVGEKLMLDLFILTIVFEFLNLILN